MNLYSPALQTDLYELTMAAGYYIHQPDITATFELYCQNAVPHRPYYVACGLQQAVDYLLSLRFSDTDIRCLRNIPALAHVPNGFFEYLRHFTFTGSVQAMREGEIFAPFEPIIQITAPLVEAQIIETYLLSVIHVQTLVATKAARNVQAAYSDKKKTDVVEFGSRRAHGPEAAVLAARAAYIGGCAGTSNVCTGARFGIPLYGTMAHAWIEVFDREEDAFAAYRKLFGKNTILLIDTYDTVRGAINAVRLKKAFRGVRLDSGDLVHLSRQVRAILDRAGYRNAKIVATGNLNEYKIEDLVRKKSPIDTFGVGTELVTSADVPALNLVYKLVQTETVDGQTRLKAKTSEGKVTIPGKKQVYRIYEPDGRIKNDIIALVSENPVRGARRLLEPVIEKGRLVKALPSIEKIRRYAQRQLQTIPASCRGAHAAGRIRTHISPLLKKQSDLICRNVGICRKSK